MTHKDLLELHYNLGCLRGLLFTVEKADIFDAMTVSLDALDELADKLVQERGGSDNE